MAEKNLPTTKQKLAAIVNGFDDFDSEMKIGTRVRHDRNSACVGNLLTARFHPIWWQQRREIDEFKIADLKNTMTRLDTELIIEIKRRTEMNKSTQMVLSWGLLRIQMMHILFGYRIVGSKLPYQMSNRFVSESNSSLLKTQILFSGLSKAWQPQTKASRKLWPKELMYAFVLCDIHVKPEIPSFKRNLIPLLCNKCRYPQNDWMS